MTERSTDHTTFVIERSFDAKPAQVFGAWADRAAKARWFVGPAGWKEQEREFDFRVGGHERVVGKWQSGTVSAFDAIYRDIVPDARIVYDYVMHLDGKKISVSLATVVFEAAGRGTKMIFTEQAVFLDGYEDKDSRERGTGALLDKLEAALKRERATT